MLDFRFPFSLFRSFLILSQSSPQALLAGVG
jgi:hypothetical protein